MRFTPSLYRIGGLTVKSELPLPRLSAESAIRPADALIRIQRDLGEPRPPRFRNPLLVAGDQDFLFRPVSGLTFRIRHGRDISIARAPHVTDRDVRAFLLGSAWGVLCHQRGLVPLHCSAVELGGQAFAFAGPSGAGKSTLAAGLSRRGLAHVCDDVCVLDPCAEPPTVQPIPKDLKLHRDSADSLGLACGPPVSTLVEKFYVAPPLAARSRSLPLTALYVLGGVASGPPTIEPIRGGAQLLAVAASVYRQEWVELIREPGELFRQLTALVQRIRLFRFVRPLDFARLPDSMARLEAHMAAVAAKEEVA